jgi:hypothetical protein
MARSARKRACRSAEAVRITETGPFCCYRRQTERDLPRRERSSVRVSHHWFDDAHHRRFGIVVGEGIVEAGLDDRLFVKNFDWVEGAQYADGGVNFETFSNELMLEVESLGPLITLKPGKSVEHVETWQLFKNVPKVKTEADADKVAKKFVR